MYQKLLSLLYNYKPKIIIFYVFISFNIFCLFNNSFQEKLYLKDEMKETEKYFRICNNQIIAF